MDLLRLLFLGLYLEKFIIWLYKFDFRVKLIWLMSFFFSFVLGSFLWCLILVVILIILIFIVLIFL